MNPLEARIAEKISVEDDCWIWHGATRGTRGKYATMRINGRMETVHRVMYEILIGPIPEGLTLDHLCKRTLCVNPFHCDPVTVRQNILRGSAPPAINARKTRCKYGHPLDYVQPDGRRQCRTCNLRRVKNYQLSRASA